MLKLSKSDYFKVKPLVKSKHSISVFSVIDGMIAGEIYVNNAEIRRLHSLKHLNVIWLRCSQYKNADKVLEWADEWGNDKTFYEKGVGNLVGFCE